MNVHRWIQAVLTVIGFFALRKALKNADLKKWKEFSATAIAIMLALVLLGRLLWLAVIGK